MKMKILFLLCLFSQVFSGEKPQKQKKVKTPPPEVYFNYVGFAAGGVTGSGISYRKWFTSGTGYQINAFPFYSEKVHEEKSTDSDRWDGYEYDGYFSLGGVYLKSMYRGKKTNVVVYSGGNWRTEYEEFEFWENSSKTDSLDVKFKDRTLENQVAVGAGGGLEYFLGRFAFHLMLGMRAAYTFETSEKGIGPTGEIGVHFMY